MARSDLLRRLFLSYSQRDDASFYATARALIAEERRQNHRLLATELEYALGDTRGPGLGELLSMRTIPKGREDRPLVRLTKPERELDELVLSPESRGAVEEIIRENLSRSTLRSHGLRPRQRLLFVGPPGTGKSATAHAIAAELSMPVAIASLAALTSSLFGDTARNIEAVVQFAEQTPCVLVFDEFDALGQDRGQTGDHGEMRRVAATVLQLLENIHGESVIVATSNHPHLMDSAVWRRFDELLPFDQLGQQELASLITLRLRAMPTAIQPSKWGRILGHLSPAEIEMACFDAMRVTVLANREAVDDAAMETAARRLESRRTTINRAWASRAKTEGT